MAKRALKMQKPADIRPLEYSQLPWGDLIYGTKEQLRSIGIAVNTPFPGEAGGSRCRLSITDPRGFKCLIEKCDYRAKGVFSASIPLPGRKQPEQAWDVFAPGVLRQENTWTDDYVGSAEALAAAGLVVLDQLPGQPGMRKVVVTLLPDGSLPKGASNTKCNAAKDPGAKSIRRVSKTTYRVSVLVEAEERSRRYAAYVQLRRAWEEKMRLTPRPAPLNARLITLAGNALAAPRYRTVGNVTYLQSA